MITKRRRDLDGMECSAAFSDDEAYRYRLEWRWSDQPALAAIMLNPSTATHEVLDPTISGLVKRARVWGHGAVIVGNLFALRATDPKVMKGHAAPIGAENDATLQAILDEVGRAPGSLLVAGWGAHGRHLGRDREVQALIRAAGGELHAFHVNADGTPKHPLYVAHDIRPFKWSI